MSLIMSSSLRHQERPGARDCALGHVYAAELLYNPLKPLLRFTLDAKGVYLHNSTLASQTEIVKNLVNGRKIASTARGSIVLSHETPELD